MVVKKVDFIDIEDVSVGLSEDSRLELFLSSLENMFEVECS